MFPWWTMMARRLAPADGDGADGGGGSGSGAGGDGSGGGDGGGNGGQAGAGGGILSSGGSAPAGGQGGTGGAAGAAGGDGGEGGAGGQGGQAGAGGEGGQPPAGEGGTPPAWTWAENVPGTGERPDWFNADKYKSVAGQARAAAGLEAKLGTAAKMLGAPEGDYELPAMPEGVEGTWDTDDPLLKEWRGVAKELGLSQHAFGVVAQRMSKLLAAEQDADRRSIADALGELGPNVAERLNQVETFIKAKIGDQGFAALDAAIGTDVAGYQALEALLAQLGDAQLSNLPGTSGLGFTKEDIDAERYKKYPEDHRLAGQIIYEHDKAHREKVDGMYKKLFPGEDVQQVG